MIYSFCIFSGDEEAFNDFIKAIFYIGKGKRARPYAHFKEAILHVNGCNKKVCFMKCVLDFVSSEQWQDNTYSSLFVSYSIWIKMSNNYFLPISNRAIVKGDIGGYSSSSELLRGNFHICVSNGENKGDFFPFEFNENACMCVWLFLLYIGSQRW